MKTEENESENSEKDSSFLDDSIGAITRYLNRKKSAPDGNIESEKEQVNQNSLPSSTKMISVVDEFHGFYLLDGKLLYASADFIGFNPIISKALIHQEPEGEGTKIILDQFYCAGYEFNVILTCFFGYGPARGYRRIEILKNGKEIIRYERGGYGHGSNYSKGNYTQNAHRTAFLIADGYSLGNYIPNKVRPDFDKKNYYLFCFDEFIIPTKYELDYERNNIPDKKIFTEAEIEPLVQVNWEGKATFNNQELHFIKTSAPGFNWINWLKKGDKEYEKNSHRAALSKLEILNNGLNCIEERKKT